jgi:hypothetical protein
MPRQTVRRPQRTRRAFALNTLGSPPRADSVSSWRCGSWWEELRRQEVFETSGGGNPARGRGLMGISWDGYRPPLGTHCDPSRGGNAGRGDREHLVDRSCGSAMRVLRRGGGRHPRTLRRTSGWHRARDPGRP